MAALEVVVVPVADVDRSVASYVALGFTVDHDTRHAEAVVSCSSRPGADTELDRIGFVRFRNPDGNGWVVQQLGGRRPDARR